MKTFSEFDVYSALLASENISVVYNRNARTASFDLRSRTLYMPVMEFLGFTEQHMMVAHEVGHAKYTNQALYIEHVKKLGAILNITEDAFVERMMKVEYPGLVRVFQKGYIGLYDGGMFDRNDKDVQEIINTGKLSLVDRLNLSMKIDHCVSNLNFSADELPFLLRMRSISSSEEALALAYDIQAKMKEQREEKKEQGQSKSEKPQKGEKGEQKEQGGEEGDEPMPTPGDGDENEDKEEKKGSTGSKKEENEKDEDTKDESDEASGDGSEKEEGDEADGNSSDADSDEEQNGEEQSEGQGETKDADGDSTGAMPQDEEADTGGAPGDSNGNDSDEEMEEGITSSTLEENLKDAFDANQKPFNLENNDLLTPFEIATGGNRLCDYLIDLTPTFPIMSKKVRAALSTMKPKQIDRNIRVSKQDLSSWKYRIGKTGIRELRQSSLGDYVRACADVRDVAAAGDSVFKSRRSAKSLSVINRKLTGSIDPRALVRYKTSDNLFRRKNIAEQQENHAFVILLDFSGSIREVIDNLIIQAAYAAEFCARNDIPFEVLAFGMSVPQHGPWNRNRADKNFGIGREAPHSIVRVASSSSWKLEDFLTLLTCVRMNPAFGHFEYPMDGAPNFTFSINFGYTPLSLAMLAAHDIIGQYRSSGVDKTCLFIVTDGDPTECNIRSANKDLNDRTWIDAKYIVTVRKDGRLFSAIPENVRNNVEEMHRWVSNFRINYDHVHVMTMATMVKEKFGTDIVLNYVSSNIADRFIYNLEQGYRAENMAAAVARLGKLTAAQFKGQEKAPAVVFNTNTVIGTVAMLDAEKLNESSKALDFSTCVTDEDFANLMLQGATIKKAMRNMMMAIIEKIA